MSDLWEAVARPYVKTAGPVRGIPLKDLFASDKPTIEINIICKKPGGWSSKSRPGQPYIADGGWQQYTEPFKDLRAEIAKLTRSAEAKAKDAADVIERCGGIDRIVLLGHGQQERLLLMEKSDWSRPWGAPGKSVPAEYGPIEAADHFYNIYEYGDDDALMKVFVQDVCGGTYDDTQFADIDEGKVITVYRGISMQDGDDPSRSVKEGQGTGSSWSLLEETAMAIAERGQAGFNADNVRTNDVYDLRVRDMKKKSSVEPGAYIPTVLRAEVVVAAEGAAPYRPWSAKYINEMEVDIPRGMEFTLTGWKQAKPVPVNESEKRKAEEQYAQALEWERQGKYDEPYFDYRNARYYVHWQWGSWHAVKIKRTASAEDFDGRLGMCYKLALQYVKDHDDGSRLVHGSIGGSGSAIARNNPNPPPRIGHAWCWTPDGDAYEPISAEVYPRREFQRLFGGVEWISYDRTKALVKALKSGHWGPWDAEYIAYDEGLRAQFAKWKRS